MIIPDQRNHGKSPHSDTFNYLAMTDDLLELIESLELTKPILLGHSMGGKVAMRLAIENPEIVKRLMVVDISLKLMVIVPITAQLLKPCSRWSLKK